MDLEYIEKFGQKLDVMKNPRKRKGFIDSFHARLIHGEIYGLNAASIREVAEIERKHGFFPHAEKLLNHPVYKKSLEEAVPYFFLVNNDCVIGTPKGIARSEKTMDISFKELVNDYDLQMKLHLASAVLLKPAWNPPLAYPLAGKELMETAAIYLSAFSDNRLEKKEREHYLKNNGLIRILINDNKLRDRLSKWPNSRFNHKTFS